MRLENDTDSLEIKTLCRRDSCSDFSGMMSVIVQDSYSAHFSYEIESTTNTRKISEHFRCALNIKTLCHQEGKNTRRIKRIVLTRILLQATRKRYSVRQCYVKRSRNSRYRIIGYRSIAFIRKAISQNLTTRLTRHFNERFIFSAHHATAIVVRRRHKVAE